MEPWAIVLIVVGALFVIGTVVMLCFTLPISKAVMDNQLVKENPEKWGRTCSDTTNEEQVQMWETGKAWAAERKDCMTELQIENDGLKLFGEYYDFGHKKCALILPGRAECLVYSYFFAIPYEKAGYNVLVIDQRTKGISDGKYDTLGAKEHRDSLKWMKYVEERFGVEEWCIHGICMGGQQTILIANHPDCPKGLTNIVIDGTFVSFRETFKNHVIYIHKPTFPVVDETMLRLWWVAGCNQWKIAPIKTVKKLKKRVLFIYGKEDVFSRPDKSQEIYDACASEDKSLVWFEHGAHSHLRFTDPEKYDSTIKAFLEGQSFAQ